MRIRGPLFMLLCVLASLLVPGIASASSAAGAVLRCRRPVGAPLEIRVARLIVLMQGVADL
jgi:hypothetical protein